MLEQPSNKTQSVNVDDYSYSDATTITMMMMMTTTTMMMMMMTVVPGPNARQRAAFVFSWTGAPDLRCAFGKRDKYVIILNSSTLGLHISSGLMS